jgi:hypothetical protein
MTDEQTPSGSGDGGGGSRGLKSLSILWAVLIGIGLVALGGSILLPSTKRARVNVEELHRLSQERAAAFEAEATAAAATQPTTEPAGSTSTAPAASSPR